MNSLIVGVITLGCVFGGAIVGHLLRALLPADHLVGHSKDAIKAATALIATLTALVLGLLVSSAKNSFDTANAALIQGGARVILLDRTLARYGPEAQPVRDLLRQSIAATVKLLWAKDKPRAGPSLEFMKAPPVMEEVQEKLWQLTPNTDRQRWLRAQAIEITGDVLQSRWLAVEQAQSGLPAMLLVVLIFWSTVLFASIGLVAPPNRTVFAVLLICALSVSGALFLIGEMSTPWQGTMKVSPAPLLFGLGGQTE